MQGFSLISEGQKESLHLLRCDSFLHRAVNLPKKICRFVYTNSFCERSVDNERPHTYPASSRQCTRSSFQEIILKRNTKDSPDNGIQIFRRATWVAIETSVAFIAASAALLLASDVMPHTFTYAYAIESTTLTAPHENMSVPTASFPKQLTSALQDDQESSPKEVDTLSPYLRSRANPQVAGLMKGRIQPCGPNPNCVSTSSNNMSYAVPWSIPPANRGAALQKIKSAVIATQKNAIILASEDVGVLGKYILAEVDGLFGRDSIEFYIKEDTVLYRSQANKVVYLYPFTTPIGDFDTQRKRMVMLESELGWRDASCSGGNCFDDA